MALSSGNNAAEDYFKDRFSEVMVVFFSVENTTCFTRNGEFSGCLKFISRKQFDVYKKKRIEPKRDMSIELKRK
jgi:hypothetical protein